jgi:hypothetical protein
MVLCQCNGCNAVAVAKIEMGLNCANNVLEVCKKHYNERKAELEELQRADMEFMEEVDVNWDNIPMSAKYGLRE